MTAEELQKARIVRLSPLERFSLDNNIRHEQAVRLRHLAQIAYDAHKAVARNSTVSNLMAYEESYEVFSTFAKRLDFDVEWPGLWPVLYRNGVVVTLPY